MSEKADGVTVLPMAKAAGSLAARVGLDNCPGALDLHDAADGPLARVRIPGGLLSAQTLAGLGQLATRCGTDAVDLTARGNVQLRGIHDADALASGLDALGLLPSVTHDRSRNYGVSPLTGLDSSGLVDATSMVAELDGLVIADAILAELPGRFLISVDDGSRTAPPADLALIRVDTGWHLLLDGRASGPAAPGDVVAAARAFVRQRGDDLKCWRIRDLPGGAAALAGALGRPLGQQVPMHTDRLITGMRAGGSVMVVAAWLQRLTPIQIAALVDATGAGQLLRLTTAGRIVVPVRSPEVLQSLALSGLIVDATDVRGLITSCSGLGECARATVDVRTVAVSLLPSRPLHLAACPRGCGRPDDAELESAE